MAKTKAMKSGKPGPPKAKKTTPLKAKKTVSLKAKDATSPLAKKKSTAAKFLALEKTDDGEFRKKALQRRQALKHIEVEDRRGVIVLSHIPHGFFEGQMRRYFRQFGVLENVRLVRSKRSGQSCGFAYVEFQHYEVAKIVAKHMDGYLTFGKIMKCKVIPPAVVSNRLFKGKRIRPDNCPKLNMRKGAIRKLNKQRTETQMKRRAARLKSTYSKKIKKLQELGIDLPLQTLLGTQQQSKSAVEGEAVNGHTTPDAPPTDIEDKDQAPMTLPEDATDVEPSQDINPDLTQKQKKKFGAARDELAAQIMSHLESAKKVKTPKKSGAKTKSTTGEEEKMVIEVDESDDEVVLKTPPNAVKRYIKMGAKSTPTTTPKGKNKTPKSAKGTPKSAKFTPKSVKVTPKTANLTPKSAKGTPKSAKFTPKSVKVTPKAANLTPKSAKVTPKSAKVTPKSVKVTPKSAKVTPKSAKKTPKAGKRTPKAVEITLEEAEDTPKAAETPKEVKATPKTPKATPGAKNVTPKAKNKTPKAAKTPPQVPAITLELDTPEAESMTPKVTPKAEKKTPKNKKMTPKIANATPKGLSNGEKHDTPSVTQATPKMEESSAGVTQNTPKTGKKTPKNKKKTPGIENLSMENSQDTPVSKKKTPKAKKMGVSENGIELDGKSTPKNTSAAASPRGRKLSPLAKKLTPKAKKMTPRTTPKAGWETTPGKTVALTPEATPRKKKGKNSQTPTHTPKRKQIEDVTPATEATPSKKKKSKKATPGKNMTPKAMSGKKTDAKTPKVTPGKRKNVLELTPYPKKQKVPMAS